jgi:hypothetical protein
MECLIQNSIEPHIERIYKKLVDLDKKLEQINKKLEKIDKLEEDILALNMKLDMQDKLANPEYCKSTMEDVD